MVSDHRYQNQPTPPSGVIPLSFSQESSSTFAYALAESSEATTLGELPLPALLFVGHPFFKGLEDEEARVGGLTSLSINDLASVSSFGNKPLSGTNKGWLCVSPCFGVGVEIDQLICKVF